MAGTDKNQKIKKIFLLSHTHTDFGYTDHVESVLLHHRDIFDQVLKVCEDSFDAPQGCQHRWTCELTSTVIDYLRNAQAKDVDRFLHLHKEGRVAVGALRYHWTPLVSKALAARTLQDIDVLRNDYGITVRSAMQCDVNGLAWFWNDLLSAKGIEFLSTHQNPHRGYWGDQVPSLWRWQGRSGGSLLVHQGEHYAVGGYHLRLGKPGEADVEELGKYLVRHAASGQWPCDFSVLNITNSAHGDNVYPQLELSQAVADWNKRGQEPQMAIVTIDQLGAMLAKVPDIETHKGEWMDSWCDGVASTPLETAVARTAERLLPVIEQMDVADDGSLDAMSEALALYDEHTWGSYTAATAPRYLLTTMQKVKKSNFAHEAFALALRSVARASRKMAATETKGLVEGDPSLDRTSNPEVGPDGQSYWVKNPTAQPMVVDWPVPKDRGSGPQISIPQAYSDEAFMPGFEDDGRRAAKVANWPDGRHRLQVSLKAGESVVIKPVLADTSCCSAGKNWIENSFCRIEICQGSGGISRWLDKKSGWELVDEGSLVLAPSVQLMKEGLSRHDMFQAPYWERSEIPMRWNPGEMFEDDSCKVKVMPGTVDASGASIVTEFVFGSGPKVQSKVLLLPRQNVVHVTAMQDTAGLERAFSLNWPLQLGEQGSRLLADTGDGLVDCAAGHVPSSCLRWQGVQSGIVIEDEDGGRFAVAALDTPLFQPHGPWWKEPHTAPEEGRGGTFWAINNHWDTNFPVSTNDIAPARFRMAYLSPEDKENVMDALQRLVAMPVIVRTCP